MRQRFSFQDVVDAIGPHAARALVARYGGTTIDIPAKARPGSVHDELSALIGEPATHALIQLCARLPLSIPRNAAQERAQRDAAIQARFDTMTTAEGLSARKAVAVLAREFCLVESSIWRALKRIPDLA